VKPADTPDSVHIGFPIRDRHSSGPGVAPQLDASGVSSVLAAKVTRSLLLLLGGDQLQTCESSRG
jgi:hypothetical protein